MNDIQTGYELLNGNEGTDVIELGAPLHEDVNRNPSTCNGYLIFVKEEPTVKQCFDQHEQIIVSKASLSEILEWCQDGTIKSGMHIALFFRALRVLRTRGLLDTAILEM